MVEVCGGAVGEGGQALLSRKVLSASFDFESGNQPVKMTPFAFTTPQMEAQRSLRRAC